MTDGVLLVDKPAGLSSHDVVLAARRALGESRVGHGGTLDPFATGLLVLLLGRATRLLPYLAGEPKRYEATIQFGAETDTDDVGGTVTVRAPTPARDAVLAAVPALTGSLDQVPPAYSAKHVDGRRAYEVARTGSAVLLAPVRVEVYEWVVREWSGDELTVTITCGGGTYVRALARDLGRLAGSAAHLTALRRTRSGVFDVSEACGLEALHDGDVTVLAPLRALGDIPVVTASDADVSRIVRGQVMPASLAAERAAIVNGEGALVALAVRRDDGWQPRVVMRRA